MKRFLTFAFALLSIEALAQEGTVSYALPNTVLTFEVEAVQEVFYAGPYARFASKYLGVNAGEKDRTSFHLVQVRMTPRIEADQSRRHILQVGNKAAAASFLKLTSQGLVSCNDGSFGEESVWRFPSAAKADFSDKGVSSNLTTESTTLYRRERENTVAVQQSVVVEKSLEKKAAEAAQMIFDLRKQKIQMVTGDTDASYGGEAMAAAIAEINRLEKEYMTLFTGYTEYTTQKMTFDVLPTPGDVQKYIAFRLSDQDGLVPADNISGKPVLLELVPQEMEHPEAPLAVKGNLAYCRIPAVCTVKLMNGTELILQSRVPVYQLGFETAYPVNLSVK